MRPYRSLFVCLLCLCFGLKAKAQTSTTFVVYDSLPQLISRLKSDTNLTMVVKFWATWCKPCVEELPYFEEYNQRYETQKVKVLLVSLDFKSQLQKKFIPFLETAKLKSEVVLFADQDANAWIPYFDQEWDGAIPATYVIKGQRNGFHQGKFADFSDLESFIKPFRGPSPSAPGR